MRDEAAALQIDAALNAQGAELRRVKEALAARDVEVDRLQKELGVLKIELSDEKARRSAEASVSADSHQAQHALRRSEDECETLRTQLAQAQEAAMRLQSASAEAEAALEARDIESKELRSRQSADGYGGSELDQRELQLLRAKADEDERALRAEQEARQAAEAHVEQLEAGREEFEAELEELRAQVSSSQRSGGGQPVSSSYGGGGGGAATLARRRPQWRSGHRQHRWRSVRPLRVAARRVPQLRRRRRWPHLAAPSLRFGPRCERRCGRRRDLNGRRPHLLMRRLRLQSTRGIEAHRPSRLRRE